MNVFKKIYDYRELLKNNVKKDVRGRYKKSVLGVLWTFLNPLLQLAVYAFIFPVILKITQPHYVIFVCVGLIPWTFFTTAVAQSSWAIIRKWKYYKKSVFSKGNFTNFSSNKCCCKFYYFNCNYTCVLYR